TLSRRTRSRNIPARRGGPCVRPIARRALSRAHIRTGGRPKARHSRREAARALAAHRPQGDTRSRKGTRMAHAPATSIATELRDKIQSRTAVFGVIGQGYVGLPLATAFAEVGFPTLGFDVNENTVAGLNAGESHIKD